VYNEEEEEEVIAASPILYSSQPMDLDSIEEEEIVITSPVPDKAKKSSNLEDQVRLMDSLLYFLKG